MSTDNPSTKNKLRRVLVTIRKVVLWSLLAIMLLLVVVVLLIQFPPVQNYIKGKVVTTITEKLHTTVKLGYIRLNFAGNLVVEDFFLADRQNDTIARIGKLKVAVNPAALFQKKVVVTSISLAGATFNYLVLDREGRTNLDFIVNAFSGGEKQEKPQNGSEWDIQIRKVQVDKSSVLFHNMGDSMQFALKLGHLRVDVDNSQLAKLKFDIRKIAIKNTRASLLTYNKIPTPQQIKKVEPKTGETKALSVSLRNAEFLAVTFEHRDSLSGTAGTYTIGEGNILPKKIDLALQIVEIANIKINNGKISYTASNKIQTTEDISTENPKVKAEDTWKIVLENADLGFDRIQLRNLVPADSGLEYLADISLSNFVAGLSASVSGSDRWDADVRSLKFEDNRTSRLISIRTIARAEDGTIRVNPLDFHLGGSHLNASAESKPGSSVTSLEASVRSSKLITSDFAPYLPKGLYASLNRFPDQLNLVADVKLSNKIVAANGELKTNQGNVRFDAKMSQADTSTYNLKVELVDLDAGFFAQNAQLGRVTATINTQGAGFKPETMNSEVFIQIASLGFMGIEYNNISITSKINNSIIAANLSSSDPLARLGIKVNGKVGDFPQFRVNTHIENLDLKAMNLITDTIALAGIIDATYTSRGEGQFVASTDTMQVNVKMPNNELNLSSGLFYSVMGDSVEAKVSSNIADVVYTGNIPLPQISGVLKNYFAQYFSKEKADSAQNSDKYFSLDVNIKDVAVLSDFANINLDVPEDAKITARLKDNQLVSDVDIEKIIFNEIEIDKLKLNASGRDSAFAVDFKTAAIHNNVHTIRDLSFNADLQNGELGSRFTFSNAASQKWFDIGGTLEPSNPELNVVLREPLMLNHQDWKIDSKNRTYIRNKNLVFNNLRLTSGDKEIALLSNAAQPEKLVASFKNLTLALISEVLYGDTSYLSGKIDGEFMATYLFAKPVPVFDAKLGINNIVLVKKPLGELNIQVSNTANNEVANLSINFGKDRMRLNLDGSYGLAKDIPMDLNFSTQNLDLAALQPLISDIVSSASGAINASLNIKGDFSKPIVNGQIAFDKAKAYLEPIQAGFQVDKQQILFRGEVVRFNNFTIKDEDGDPMEITGSVTLADLKKLNYNLNIHTEEFLAYQGPPNSFPGQDNKLIVSSDIKLTGHDKTPQVEADVTIDEGSKFFYKITKQSSTLTEEGVIEFDRATDVKKEEVTKKESVAENLNLTTNITVAENTGVTIITDPVRNLGLKMVAGGRFSLNQRPYQAPSLTGRLDISGGDYTISLSGIKRKFEIADSSFIVWYGNISKPELNLRAYYEVRTSPAELIGSTETSSTLPFLVNMIITGNLDNPKFNFRLSLPSEYEGVNNGMVAAKLQEVNSNESELNQKAMTLLLFGSFGFNNFANVLGNNAGTNVLISNALNQFAAQKLKFIDLHFDLESYDNYGGETQDNLRTEMKIAASKKLLNDRLRIALGSTVVLQADEQEQQEGNLADRISPEFNIRYLLNKPRTLSVETFRKSEYRGLVEGKVISTGAGILFQKDFNKISELFRKPKESEPVAENKENTDNGQ